MNLYRVSPNSMVTASFLKYTPIFEQFPITLSQNNTIFTYSNNTDQLLFSVSLEFSLKVVDYEITLYDEDSDYTNSETVFNFIANNAAVLKKRAYIGLQPSNGNFNLFYGLLNITRLNINPYKMNIYHNYFNYENLLFDGDLLHVDACNSIIKTAVLDDQSIIHIYVEIENGNNLVSFGQHILTGSINEIVTITADVVFSTNRLISSC